MSKAVSGVILTLFLTGMLASTLAVTSGNWVWVRDTVTGYYGEAVVGTGDCIYIARRSSFYRYRPADDSWMEMATPPNPDPGDAFKTGTALAWDGDEYIYSLYGAATGDSRRWFYRYSISGDSWEALANTTADQGEGDAIACVGLDDCIYATIGGEQRPTYFIRYDPSNKSWNDAAVADQLDGMGDGASLVWTGGNFIYALCGEFYETSPLYDFWRYNLTSDAWAVMADIPADPHSGGVGGVGDGGSLLYVGLLLADQADFIYALSGNQAEPDSIPDNRFYRYTISTNSWERLENLPFGVGYYVGGRLGYADGAIYAWQGTPSTWAGGGDDVARYELAPTPRTWIVDDDGPADFHTIQEAVDAASDGDSIYVYSGTYYEHLVVNKPLTLVGESKKSTIVDGSGTGTVIKVTDNNVSISGFTIQNSGSQPGTSYAGIKISGGMHANLTGNHVTRNKIGLFVTSQKSRIVENSVTNNGQGIALYDSSEVTVEANNVTANTVGISLALSFNNIIVNNSVTNSSPGGHGITLSSNSFNNTIFSNDLTNNYHGIWLSGSSNNWIVENNIANNELLGIELANSPDNTIYHNNFINNPKHVVIDESISVWDDGYPSGGNYWSDYADEDAYSGPYQNETGSDGIGDTPYIINGNNIDHYPLMTPLVPILIHDISVVSVVPSSNEVYEGQIVNITVSVKNNGKFTETFNVTAYASHQILEFIVTIQTKPVTNLTLGNQTTLTFSWNTTDVVLGNYTISAEASVVPEETYATDNVKVNGTVNVIPEFASMLLLFVVFVATTVVSVFMKRKRTSKNTSSKTSHKTQTCRYQ